MDLISQNSPLYCSTSYEEVLQFLHTLEFREKIFSNHCNVSIKEAAQYVFDDILFTRKKVRLSDNLSLDRAEAVMQSLHINPPAYISFKNPIKTQFDHLLRNLDAGIALDKLRSFVLVGSMAYVKELNCDIVVNDLDIVSFGPSSSYAIQLLRFLQPENFYFRYDNRGITTVKFGYINIDIYSSLINECEFSFESTRAFRKVYGTNYYNMSPYLCIVSQLAHAINEPDRSKALVRASKLTRDIGRLK